MPKMKGIYVSSVVAIIAGILVTALCTAAASTGSDWIANWGAVAVYLVVVLVAGGFIVQRVRSLRLLAKEPGISAKTERTACKVIGSLCALAAIGYIAAIFGFDSTFAKCISGFSSLFFVAGAVAFFGRERSLAWGPQSPSTLSGTQPVPAQSKATHVTRERPPAAVPPVEKPKPTPAPTPAAKPAVTEAPFKLEPTPRPEAPVVADAPVKREPAPKPAAPVVVETPPFVLEPAPKPAAPVIVEAPIKPEPIPEPVAPVVASAPAKSEARSLPADDFSFDQEIREIFIEEAEEVLESINSFFPVWSANFEKRDAMLEVRRGFHTLKGSGRMVGALSLAELAWSIESMLNKVRDKTVAPSPAMMRLIGNSLELLPDLVEDFSQSNAPRFNALSLVEVAEAFIRGEQVSLKDVTSATEEAREAGMA